MAQDRTTTFENIKGRVKYLKRSEPSGFETEKALCEEIDRLREEVVILRSNIEAMKRSLERILEVL
jgi:hypothetical protein